MPRITPIDWRSLVKVFEAEGFTKVRQKGSHIVLEKAGVARPLVIPIYDAIGIAIIKSNLKTAGISRERYFELLEQL
nr:type II toxin-antitoxin system HicA family toxin [Gammaproteobacteria bacterium]